MDVVIDAMHAGALAPLRPRQEPSGIDKRAAAAAWRVGRSGRRPAG